MSLSNEQKNKLREEFQKFADTGLWQGEDEYTKNFAIGNVADFFISHFDQILESKEEEIRKEITTELLKYKCGKHKKLLQILTERGSSRSY